MNQDLVLLSFSDGAQCRPLTEMLESLVASEEFISDLRKYLAGYIPDTTLQYKVLRIGGDCSSIASAMMMAKDKHFALAERHLQLSDEAFRMSGVIVERQEKLRKLENEHYATLIAGEKGDETPETISQLRLLADSSIDHVREQKRIVLDRLRDTWQPDDKGLALRTELLDISYAKAKAMQRYADHLEQKLK